MDNVQAFIEQFAQWVFIGVVLVCVLVANRIVRWVTQHLMKRNPPEKHVWLHAGLSALDAPLRLLIWILGFFVVLTHVLVHFEIQHAYLPTLRSVLVILTVGWLLFRFVNRVQQDMRTRASTRDEAIDSTALDAISKICFAVIAVFQALSIMQTLHVPLSGLLAFGGAAGIAFGFAAQTLVANMFGGLTIFISRIFKIGEDIIIPGTELSGEVQHIGWRSTKVLGWDCKPFYIPNSVFNASTVINHKRMTHRCAEEYVHLRYEDMEKIPEFVRKGNEMLQAREDVDYFVFRFDSYAERSLQFFLYAYIRTKDYAVYMRLKEEILLQIAAFAREEGCQLVLPVSHLRMESDSGLGADHAPSYVTDSSPTSAPEP